MIKCKSISGRDSDFGKAKEDDDVLLELEALAPPVIRTADDIVHARCVEIMPRKFGFGPRGEYVKPCVCFTFVVIDDGRPHHGQRLSMYVHVEPTWKSLPRSSKALHIVRVALGTQIVDQTVIRKSWFIGKTFRCQIAQTGKAPNSCTIIKTILEKIGA